MSIDFSKVVEWGTSSGALISVADSLGNVLWSRALFNYVSLGDSIAVGHAIDENWESQYGYQTQYGEGSNKHTVIVDGSYTDLLMEELISVHGPGHVSAKSFAHSGDTVADLMTKLTHEGVINAIKKADLVTVCIGANDVLQPAMTRINEYINAGDSALAEISADVTAKLNTLNNDSASTSFVALFDALNRINPDAKYVFTTVYNPYKYLWLDEGTGGFFSPVLSSIPPMTILGFDITPSLRNGLLDTPAIQTLYRRVNGLCSWSEKFVEGDGSFSGLNKILRRKITQYGKANFILADTKPLFDGVPDRLVSATNHYNDLVNVEYTRGYDTMQMDWGQLYGSQGAAAYWLNLATKHTSTSGIDIGSIGSELVADTVARVIVPDLDPHPESYGHYALRRSFDHALGMSSLVHHTIKFVANGGTGTMASQTVVGFDRSTPAYTNIAANTFTAGATGYRFAGWNTRADGSGVAYSSGQLVGLTSNLTLYAQWSNIYTVTFRHSYDAIGFGSGDTGPMESYALWIDGVEQSDLGAFSNGPRTYRLAYGTPMGVVVQNKLGSDRCYVTWNGTTVAGKSSDTRYSFNLTGDLDINFEWNFFLDGLSPQSYWNCYITTR